MQIKKVIPALFVFLFFLMTFTTAVEIMDNTKIDLVNLRGLDPTIIVDLKYASPGNVFGKTLYGANTAYLRKSTADKLVIANKKLQERGLGLKIWDAYRPLSVQKTMWELKPDPKFVANPDTGSDHNRGCAVDVTLVDKNGKELLMPTKFDDFSAKAKSNYYSLPRAALKNRDILKAALTSEGFSQYENEWWHFTDENRKTFGVLDISFEELAKIDETNSSAKNNQKLFPSFENKKIIFDLSAIKDEITFPGSPAAYAAENQINTDKGIVLEAKAQEFYLYITASNGVLLNKENYELTLTPVKEITQFYFFINNEQTFPKEKIFNIMGKASVKTEIFVLKSRGFNWQEDENTIKIKVFKYK